jgi:hypothetical protein
MMMMMKLRRTGELDLMEEAGMHHILSRVVGVVNYKTGFGLDLLTPYTHHSTLHGITAPSLIYTLYSSPLNTH